MAATAKKTKKAARSKAGSASGGFARISEAAVLKGTGKGWAHWFAVLDRFDVRTKGHAAAAVFLAAKQKLTPWWSQMVVVGYEQGRGLRQKNERKKGFAAGASRTMAVGMKKVWKFWQPGGTNARWLGATCTKKAGARKSWMRLRWEDGTDVLITFTPKAGGKTQVVAEQEGLESQRAAGDVKEYWKFRLELLAAQMGCDSELSEWFGALKKR